MHTGLAGQSAAPMTFRPQETGRGLSVPPTPSLCLSLPTTLDPQNHCVVATITVPVYR